MLAPFISAGTIRVLQGMNDVLAIIAGGGRAIIVIDREGVEINYILL